MSENGLTTKPNEDSDFDNGHYIPPHLIEQWEKEAGKLYPHSERIFSSGDEP